MLLFIIELFPILALAKSPFLSVNSCNLNQTFVINRDHGAVCNHDESYITNSIQYMISRKKFYEFVPNNISESQEFVCKVNSTQYSDVFFVDTNMTKETQSAIPIVCHVPEVAEDSYTDVEVWNYKPSTNTADLMKIVDTTEPRADVWNEYIDHVQFSRSENIAGLKGDYGSTVLRWDDAPYNPCGNCSATTNGLVFNHTFKSENYCLLRENYCVYSDSVNCTSSFGGACFDSSALTAPAPPPRLPPPPFPPGLAPPPVETYFNQVIQTNQYINGFALKVNTTVDLNDNYYLNKIPNEVSLFSFEGTGKKLPGGFVGPHTLVPGQAYYFLVPSGIPHFNITISGNVLNTNTFIQTDSYINSFSIQKNVSIDLNSNEFLSVIPDEVSLFSFEGTGKKVSGGFVGPSIIEFGKPYHFLVSVGVQHFNITL